MRDQIFALQMPQSIFQFYQLDKNIVFGIKSGRGLRGFEIKREPFLNALHFRTLRQIHKQSQIQNERRGENRIAAHKINFDLHLVAEPAENINRVPAFFVIAARRIIVDADDVRKIFVKFGISFRLQEYVRERRVSILLWS